MLKKILGDVTVIQNGNGFTARHLGKSASSTSHEEAAMDACLRKTYGEGNFYYRQIQLLYRKGRMGRIFHAVVEKEAA